MELYSYHGNTYDVINSHHGVGQFNKSFIIDDPYFILMVEKLFSNPSSFHFQRKLEEKTLSSSLSWH